MEQLRRRKKGRVRSARFVWPSEWLDAIFAELDIDLFDRQIRASIASATKILSDTFIERTCAGSVSKRRYSAEQQKLYGNDVSLRRAYTAYYLPANVPKIVEILESVRRPWGSIRHILDIGAGPGTAAVAFLVAHYRAGLTTPVHITACDHSRDFLELSRQIIALFRRILNIPGDNRFVHFDLVKDSEKSKYIHLKTGYDVVFASNVIAEIPDAAPTGLAKFLADQVKPGGHIVFLEPARRQPARHITAVRDELARSGWKVLFPCPASYPCPLMHRQKDWCHHRLIWKTPDHISQIDTLMGMEKNLLNFTGFILEKPLKIDLINTEPGVFRCDRKIHDIPCRVISDVMPQKGRYCAHVCGSFDGKAQALPAVLEKKRMTHYNDCFANLARYDLIRLRNVNIRGNQLILDESSQLATCFEDCDGE